MGALRFGTPTHHAPGWYKDTLFTFFYSFEMHQAAGKEKIVTAVAFRFCEVICPVELLLFVMLSGSV